jgi:phospho-N-acetylmuramoyl-pentapeptide-transferase
MNFSYSGALEGFVLSLMLMLFIGSPMISALKRVKGAKWAPREDTPDSHLQKAGIPSMGGIGIIGSALSAWFLLRAIQPVILYFLDKDYLLGFGILGGLIGWIFLLITLFPLLIFGHAILGYVDDLSKARSKGGISSKQKLAGQMVLALGLLAVFHYLVQFLAGFKISMSGMDILNQWWMWPLAFAIIIGTSNAVNLTDGIDGLAAGLSVQVSLAFFVVGLGQEKSFTHSTIFVWMCLGGACLGFLAFNKNPAKVFMGDTGSLALGAALGAGAILTQTVFLLPFIGFIFFVEMFSVIFQVAYFKYTKKKFGEGKRIFRRAPLHHHFELGGWREWRVVGTFWAINAVTSILGLALWKAGVLPKFPF